MEIVKMIVLALSISSWTLVGMEQHKEILQAADEISDRLLLQPGSMPVDSLLAAVTQYLDEKKLTAQQDTLVKQALANKLSDKIFKQMSTWIILKDCAYCEQVNIVHFDGTVSCQDRHYHPTLDHFQAKLVKQKPTTPWQNLSWRELLTRYKIVSNALQEKAPYPN